MAITKKVEERNTLEYVKNYSKYIEDIKESPDLNKIWRAYQEKYIYAKDITFMDIVGALALVFDAS